MLLSLGWYVGLKACPDCYADNVNDYVLMLCVLHCMFVLSKFAVLRIHLDQLVRPVLEVWIIHVMGVALVR